jgi:predicted RNA binding protein YcfA (HicA-like mRNA interferase family)
MTQIAKLYARLLVNPNVVISFRDFEALFRAFGFEKRPGKGSHCNFKHPGVPIVLTVQPRGKDAVPYQVKRLLEVVMEYDLHMPE